MANWTFINESGTIGIIFEAVTNNVTGSAYLTLLGFMIIIILFFMLFRVPIEFTAILILPMCIIFMSFFGEFLVIGLTLLMYIGLLIAKNFFIR